MSDHISQAAEAMRESNRQAVANYWTAVHGLATGEKTLHPADLAESCRAAGRSIEDFESDCRLVRRRLDLEATAAERPDLERQLGEVNKRLDKAGEKFAKAEDEFENTRNALGFDAKQLRLRLAECDQAAGELATSCPYPALTQRREQLEQQRQELHERGAALREQIARLEATAEHGRQVAAGQVDLTDEQRFNASLGKSGVELDAAEHRMRRQIGARAAKATGRAAELRAHLMGVEAQLAEVAEQEKALAAQLRKP